MRSIANNLSRGTVALVVDHHTVHHAENTASIHFEEKDTTGKTIRGGDVDGVTVEELGGTGEISTVITGAKLVSFMVSASGGLPTTIAVKPPEPVLEKEAPAAPTASAP